MGLSVPGGPNNKNFNASRFKRQIWPALRRLKGMINIGKILKSLSSEENPSVLPLWSLSHMGHIAKRQKWEILFLVHLWYRAESFCPQVYSQVLLPFMSLGHWRMENSRWVPKFKGLGSWKLKFREDKRGKKLTVITRGLWSMLSGAAARNTVQTGSTHSSRSPVTQESEGRAGGMGRLCAWCPPLMTTALVRELESTNCTREL